MKPFVDLFKFSPIFTKIVLFVKQILRFLILFSYGFILKDINYINEPYTSNYQKIARSVVYRLL
jgi:hypothetical protein